MRELLPFFFGCLVSPLVLRRSQPVRVVAAFILYFAQNIYAGAFGVGGYRE